MPGSARLSVNMGRSRCAQVAAQQMLHMLNREGSQKQAGDVVGSGENEAAPPA
jgi:hypothetical protein